MLNLEQIVKRSYRNCHAQGLHSIVFDEDSNGFLKRMFYTDKNHVLFNNHHVLDKDLTIALHSHHCDIGITVIKGEIWNITAEIEQEPTFSNIDGWLYESAIKNEKGSFRKMYPHTIMNVKKQKLSQYSNPLCAMKASEYHTVYVESGMEAAWIIHEGIRDPNYDSMCFSNNDLTKFNFRDHYLPITLKEVETMLKLYNWAPVCETKK